MVLPGVRIGDGAVIGARSVVAGDIPPYAVAVGNPARIVRYRFDEATIAALLELAWWSWPAERITEALPAIQTGTLAALAAVARDLPPRPTDPTE